MTVMRHLGHCTQHNELTDGCISCGDAEAQLARATGQPTAAVALHHLRGAVSECERLRVFERAFAKVPQEQQARLMDAVRADAAAEGQ